MVTSQGCSEGQLGIAWHVAAVPPNTPSLVPQAQVKPGPHPGLSHSRGQACRLWGAAHGLWPFLRKRKPGSRRRERATNSITGAGGLFITLAPLQTDVSFYSELALNGSLVSSFSHGLKTEGERGGDVGESAGLALVPRPPVLAPHSDVWWRARGWRFAGFCVWMLWFPLAQRGRMAVLRQG